MERKELENYVNDSFTKTIAKALKGIKKYTVVEASVKLYESPHKVSLVMKIVDSTSSGGYQNNGVPFAHLVEIEKVIKKSLVEHNPCFFTLTDKSGYSEAHLSITFCVEDVPTPEETSVEFIKNLEEGKA